MESQHIRIEAGRIEKNYWKDVWQFRELFMILSWRDISVRYKQTLLGFLWAVIRPFLTMLIFTIIFSRIARLPSEGEAPYAIMVMAGMLPWLLFSTSLSEASMSLINNSNLISKVYFPRMIVPMASIITSLVDFLICTLLLFLLFIYFGFMPGWQVVFLPAFVLLAILASIGPGLWITAINVKYRDFRYVIPFIVQFGLYISPVGFSSNVIPEKWRLLYNLNPIVAVIDGFRWCILGNNEPIYWPGLGLSVFLVFAMLYIGIRKFRNTERSFADII